MKILNKLKIFSTHQKNNKIYKNYEKQKDFVIKYYHNYYVIVTKDNIIPAFTSNYSAIKYALSEGLKVGSFQIIKCVKKKETLL